MIKIVHIAKPIGGVGVYIELLSMYLCSDTFKNILLCNTKDKILQIKNNKGVLIDVKHINLEREINLINDFSCFLKIMSLLKKIKPDIIHCHSAKAGILGRIAGALLNIPTVYTPHAYSYLSTKSTIKKFLYKKIEQFFGLLPSKTLACSESEYNRTINDLNFHKNKVLLWNNSIEDNFIFEEIFFHLPKKFICSIGRPSYQKNTILLIQSFFELKKQLKDTHLVILGVGHHSPDLEKTQRLIQKLNLKDSVTLIPWLERTQTLSILQKGTIYVSTSRYEGLPYALIEALALSKASVVTNVDGNKDLIQNNYNGYVVNENPIKIASKIIAILKNNELRKEMEQKSNKLYNDKFNIKKNIHLLEQIYMQLN